LALNFVALDRRFLYLCVFYIHNPGSILQVFTCRGLAQRSPAFKTETSRIFMSNTKLPKLSAFIEWFHVFLCWVHQFKKLLIFMLVSSSNHQIGVVKINILNVYLSTQIYWNSQNLSIIWSLKHPYIRLCEIISVFWLINRLLTHLDF